MCTTNGNELYMIHIEHWAIRYNSETNNTHKCMKVYYIPYLML